MTTLGSSTSRPLMRSEPEYAHHMTKWVNRKDDLPEAYIKDISSRMSPRTRDMLENYSGIPPDQIDSHVHTIRDKAWAIRPYPCIGSGLYLDPAVVRHPLYNTVLSRLRSDTHQRLLEVGSFMGSDLRCLVADGTPSSSLIATDIVNFFDLGHEMFRDKDRFTPQFMQADLLAYDGPLKQFQHSIDIVYVSKVLHLWHYEKQRDACCRLVDLSRVGTLIFADQLGAKSSQVLNLFPNVAGHFIHNAVSWRQMWDEVEGLTGTKWGGKTQFVTFEEFGLVRDEHPYVPEDAMWFTWSMTRKA